MGGQGRSPGVVLLHRRIIVTQLLGDHELVQRQLALNHVQEHRLHKLHSLLDILLQQEDVKGAAIHILHNRRVVPTLQDDTHGCALTLGRILLILHPDVPLAAEQNEGIEGLLVTDDERLVWAAGGNHRRSLLTLLDRRGKILGRELHEDRIRIPIHHRGSKLCLHRLLCKQERTPTDRGRTCGYTDLADGRCPRPQLTIDRVGDHLVG